jgi:hypothetical protein
MVYVEHRVNSEHEQRTVYNYRHPIIQIDATATVSIVSTAVTCTSHYSNNHRSSQQNQQHKKQQSHLPIINTQEPNSSPHHPHTSPILSPSKSPSHLLPTNQKPTPLHKLPPILNPSNKTNISLPTRHRHIHLNPSSASASPKKKEPNQNQLTIPVASASHPALPRNNLNAHSRFAILAIEIA